MFGEATCGGGWSGARSRGGGPLTKIAASIVTTKIAIVTAGFNDNRTKPIRSADKAAAEKA